MGNRFLFFLLLLYSLSIWPAGAREYKVCDIIGDSISFGVNPDFRSGGRPQGGHGWAQMLFGQEGNYPTITNLWPRIAKNNSAVSGSTAAEWAAPSSAAMQQVLNHKPDLVVVYIGGNDFLDYAADGAISDAEKDKYRADLVTIIDRLRSNTPQPDIILFTYYDLFDGLSENLPFILRRYYPVSQGAIDGNIIIRDVAREKNCYLIDGIYEAFFHHCYGASLGDTNHLQPEYVDVPLIPNFDIHPNTVGHTVLHQKIYGLLQSLRTETPTGAGNWDLYY